MGVSVGKLWKEKDFKASLGRDVIFQIVLVCCRAPGVCMEAHSHQAINERDTQLIILKNSEQMRGEVLYNYRHIFPS